VSKELIKCRVIGVIGVLSIDFFGNPFFIEKTILWYLFCRHFSPCTRAVTDLAAYLLWHIGKICCLPVYPSHSTPRQFFRTLWPS